MVNCEICGSTFKGKIPTTHAKTKTHQLALLSKGKGSLSDSKIVEMQKEMNDLKGRLNDLEKYVSKTMNDIVDINAKFLKLGV